MRSCRAGHVLLTDEERTILNALGFVWDPHDELFEKNAFLLKRFVHREGHARVPAKHVEAEVKLGVWVGGVRARRAELSADRIRRLDALGFVWDPFGEQFDSNMRLLSRYVAREGHAKVPAQWVEDGVRLGGWVSSLRSKADALSAERIAQLDALGFVWDLDGVQWSENLRLLRQFVHRVGHAKVPTNHIEEDTKLGTWVSGLRSRRVALSPARIAELDALGFVWSVRGKKSAREPHDAPLDMQEPEGTSDPEVRPGRDEPRDG